MNILIGALMFLIGCISAFYFSALGEKNYLAIPSIIGCAVSMTIGFVGILIAGMR